MSLLLTFYGDDFTGSTDVMEALALAGLRTVLFLEPPAPADLERFPGVRAVGVAGTSRAMTPAEMEEALPPVFERLKALGAPLTHYKACSTFDSSPEIGSIGRAIDLGQRVFRSPYVPLVVGAPVLRRYCLFGNLFATAGAETFRIDRHPTMRSHPVTPMDEGDLRVHLGRQTSKRIGLVDLLQLNEARLRAVLAEGAEVVLFDVLDGERLARVGGLIEATGPSFAVGSSGIEYALVGHWRLSAPPRPAAEPARQVLVLSGSCSPATAGQIGWALGHGFEGVRLDGEASARRTLDALGRGRSVVLYTARGPADPAIADPRGRGAALGERLGELARRAVEETGVRRLVVAGGDTSGRVARALGIRALETIVPIAPGSPLCRAHGDLPGLEVALKGGQVGQEDYFGRVLEGKEIER